MPTNGSPDHWTRRFEDQVLDKRDVHQHEDRYLFRPGQVLVHHDDHQHVADRLSRHYGAREHDQHSALLREHGIPLRVYRLGDAHARAVPHVVQELRGALGTRPLRIAPNHVFTGHPGYTPGGAGVPKPTPALSEASPSPSGDPLVTILDTGVPSELSEWHKNLDAAVVPGSGESVDVLDADGDDLLDLEAGHGTFVAAVLAAAAPGTRFTVTRVLEPCGIGDEIEIASAIRSATTPILSMSLGGYTYDDQPPTAIADAIAGLGDDRLVVASAGNGNSERPTWPAALDGVIGVGALVESDYAARADFSNYGPWVSACAPASDVTAAYVFGRYPTAAGVEDFAGWATWSGTSFAVPKVVGAVVARMRESDCTARAAWESLCQDADREFIEDLGYVFR